jgi:hypothetical protein
MLLAKSHTTGKSMCLCIIRLAYVIIVTGWRRNSCPPFSE